MGYLAGQRSFSGQRQKFSHLPAVATKTERPLPVTLIASLQLVKGIFLLLVAALARTLPDELRNVPGLPAVLYFAAHGRNVQGFLLPVVGVYVTLTGYGLWRLWGWARRTLIFSSGVMIALWIYRFVSDWKATQEALRNPMDEEMVYFLIFIDVVIVAYLAFYDGVSRAFEKARS